jgi:2-polyprenyl-3-methyl-5-hydroxy-6-metoxy-1,4-benzoquinol methylase
MNKESKEKVYANAGNPEVVNSIPKDTIKILDLGCGAGDNARLIVTRNSKAQVHGVTLAAKEKPQAEKFCTKVFIYNLEQGLPVEIERQYDAVIASHVLEHICYPQTLLAAVKNKLATDGVFVIALPNIMCWRYRIKLLIGKFDYTETGVMDYTHFRWYTFESAQRLLAENGFNVVESNGYGGFPFGPLRNILPNSILKLCDKTACKFLPGLFSYQMVFSAKNAN